MGLQGRGFAAGRLTVLTCQECGVASSEVDGRSCQGCEVGGEGGRNGLQRYGVNYGESHMTSP